MAGKRRANGEGSITPRKDGRWMARYKVTEPTGVRKTRYIYGKTKDETAKKLRKAQSEVDRGRVAIKNNYTVESFYNTWLISIAPNYLQSTTIEQYKWTFSKYIIPRFGNKRLDCLITKDIQDFINQVYIKTNSARICKEVRNCLSGVLKRAIRQQLLTYNPVTGVESPSYKPEEKHPWNIEELNIFLSATPHCKYFPIFKLTSYYGMRKGEVLGLRVKDIDLNSENVSNNCYGLIHIRQQVSLVNNKPVVRNQLKTKASERDLPITREMRDFLLPLIANRNKEELLFHTPSNNPINPNNLLRAFKRESKRASLRIVTFHTLRHTACTLLRDADVDIKTAQVIMGHSDPTTTLRVYQHSDMDKKVEALNKLDSLYNSSM